jgi:predicted amidophosphoribosyltransferase
MCSYHAPSSRTSRLPPAWWHLRVLPAGSRSLPFEGLTASRWRPRGRLVTSRPASPTLRRLSVASGQGYAPEVSKSRDEWVDAMREADVLDPPLAPPAACSRCLRPLEANKRPWGTCYACGHEHPQTLPRITAVTYGASGTRAWSFFTTTKFGNVAADKLKTFVKGIAATLSQEIETSHPEFTNGDDAYVVVPVPSSNGLVKRCLEVIAAKKWSSLIVVDALTAAQRPKQTDLGEAERREAAVGKYTASDAVAGKHVLLLDDAYTSGYTIHDAARAVSAAGALSVSCVVYARRVHSEAMAIYRAELGENGDDDDDV